MLTQRIDPSEQKLSFDTPAAINGKRTIGIRTKDRDTICIVMDEDAVTDFAERIHSDKWMRDRVSLKRENEELRKMLDARG